MPKVKNTESYVEKLKKQLADTKRQAATPKRDFLSFLWAAAKADAEQREKAAMVAAAEAERQQELDKEAAALEAQLRESYKEVGKLTNRDSLALPALFIAGGRAEILSRVNDDAQRMEIVQCVEGLEEVQAIIEGVTGQLACGWIVEDRLGNPYGHEFYLCWDHYEEPGYQGSQSVYVGVNAMGTVVDWDTTPDWVKLRREHEKAGLNYISLHDS